MKSGECDLVSLGKDRLRVSPMNHFRGEHRDSAMAVDLVVPGEKGPAPAQSVLLTAEAVGKAWTVLEGFEVTFREGIVIRYMRSAVAFGDPQVGKKLTGAFRFHRRSAVGVKGQLAFFDPLLIAAFANETLGQFGTLALRHHPAHGEAAEDVEHHVEVEIGPLLRPLEFGDIPGPDLIGPGSQ